MANLMRCPSCEVPLKLPEPPSGKNLRCPKCRHVFRPHTIACCRDDCGPKQVQASALQKTEVTRAGDNLSPGRKSYEDIKNGVSSPGAIHNDGGAKAPRLSFSPDTAKRLYYVLVQADYVLQVRAWTRGLLCMTLGVAVYLAWMVNPTNGKPDWSLRALVVLITIGPAVPFIVLSLRRPLLGFKPLLYWEILAFMATATKGYSILRREYAGDRFDDFAFLIHWTALLAPCTIFVIAAFKAQRRFSQNQEQLDGMATGSLASLDSAVKYLQSMYRWRLPKVVLLREPKSTFSLQLSSHYSCRVFPSQSELIVVRIEQSLMRWLPDIPGVWIANRAPDTLANAQLTDRQVSCTLACLDGDYGAIVSQECHEQLQAWLKGKRWDVVDDSRREQLEQLLAGGSSISVGQEKV